MPISWCFWCLVLKLNIYVDEVFLSPFNDWSSSWFLIVCMVLTLLCWKRMYSCNSLRLACRYRSHKGFLYFVLTLMLTRYRQNILIIFHSRTKLEDFKRPFLCKFDFSSSDIVCANSFKLFYMCFLIFIILFYFILGSLRFRSSASTVILSRTTEKPLVKYLES